MGRKNRVGKAVGWREEDKGRGGKRKIGSKTRVSRNTGHFVRLECRREGSETYETKG